MGEVGQSEKGFQAERGPGEPAGKFVADTVWIDAAAVSFDRDDLSDNLIFFDRFIKGAGRISAENKKTVFR